MSVVRLAMDNGCMQVRFIDIASNQIIWEPLGTAKTAWFKELFFSRLDTDNVRLFTKFETNTQVTWKFCSHISLYFTQRTSETQVFLHRFRLVRWVCFDYHLPNGCTHARCAQLRMPEVLVGAKYRRLKQEPSYHRGLPGLPSLSSRSCPRWLLRVKLC